VRAFISGIDTQTDVATELFVLHPTGYDGPSRACQGNLDGVASSRLT
jgi:hypothetical protein